MNIHLEDNPFIKFIAEGWEGHELEVYSDTGYSSKHIIPDSGIVKIVPGRVGKYQARIIEKGSTHLSTITTVEP